MQQLVEHMSSPLSCKAAHERTARETRSKLCFRLVFLGHAVVPDLSFGRWHEHNGIETHTIPLERDIKYYNIKNSVCPAGCEFDGRGIQGAKPEEP